MAQDARWEARFTALEAKVAALSAIMEQRFAQFEAKVERRFGEQTRSMYLAWAVLLAAVAGLYLK